MSEVEQNNTPIQTNNNTHEVVDDFEVFEMPQELKDLQELTKISDQHVQKLIKTYKNELVTSPLLLWLEAYYGEIKDTKSLENLIDKVTEKKLTNEEMVSYIVEDCLNVRTTREDLADLSTNIDYAGKQIELYYKIKELESKSFDKISLDNESRNEALKSITNPAEKLVLSYISTKDIPFPEIETTAKNSSAAQDPKLKDLSTRELIEHTDKVPWGIIKDLKLAPEQAKIIKELNYKTFIQIVRTNPRTINKDLIIDAIRHEKSMDKIQDKLIQKGSLVPDARTKYGSKVAKAVVNYSINQVFGNAVFKKSAASQEIKTELDVANLLAHYMTSWKIEKDPKPTIAKSQSYTNSRVELKTKTETSSQEEAVKQNQVDIEDLRKQLLDITNQKEAAEKRELDEITKTIQSITGGFDIEEIKSEKRKYGTNSTLCSRTACLNIENLVDMTLDWDVDTETAPVPKWDAKNLIPSLLKSKAASKIQLKSFNDINETKALEDKLRLMALETKGNVFDMYFYTKGKHRTVVFLWSDSKFYALDPYHWGGKTRKPVPLADLLKNLSPKVIKNDIVINNTVYAQISPESQKKLQEAYKKVKNNYSLQTKLEEYYGDEDIVYKLSQYNDTIPYQDNNITNLPVIKEPVKQPEVLQEDFTIEMLKLHVPKIYWGITYEELYTAITNISDPSLKIQCILKIKAEKIMDFQLLLWMLKDAPLENKADGKVWQHTLNKIKNKINIATVQIP